MEDIRLQIDQDFCFNRTVIHKFSELGAKNEKDQGTALDKTFTFIWFR